MRNKYTEHFKLQVVQAFLCGDDSVKGVARQHGLNPSMVRKWVSRYRHNGSSGLRQKPYTTYSATFKLDVLERMWRDGLSMRQTEALFDIRRQGVISQWMQQYHREGATAFTPICKGQSLMVKTPSSPPAQKKTDDRSRKELLDELAYLRAENAYFKKARCLDPGADISPAQKAQVIQGLRHHHALNRLLRAAQMARSTFYYQVKRLAAGDRYAGVKQRIQGLYDHHKGRYGYRRITLALRKGGETINHKTVQKLMQQLGLKSLVRQKKYRAYQGGTGYSAPNTLKRRFQAERPNQRWVTDITEFKVNDQKLYLSPVMDLYNGEIIAFQTGPRPVFDLVKGMLKKAFNRLTPEDRVVLHSDQGWHYRHANYRKLVVEKRILRSMSRKGNCLDNAAIESFFGTLKAEYFYLNQFDNLEQLQKGIANYIHYYNHHRLKQKLQGLSPVEYRTQEMAVN
ncbi:IS3 family transposase [Halomonas sp. AOP30-A1-24]|uniref:IS3 family transposase n=1 Tax=Halomonas sp. AOP30-A1-24 TaxID=3457698 RepID=UPI004033B93B